MLVVHVDVSYVLTNNSNIRNDLRAQSCGDILVPRDVSIVPADSLIRCRDSGWVDDKVSRDIAYVSADPLRISRNAFRVDDDARHDSLDIVWVCEDFLEHVTELQLIQPDSLTVKGDTNRVGTDLRLVWEDVCGDARENGGVNRAALTTTTTSSTGTNSSDVSLECSDIISGAGN